MVTTYRDRIRENPSVERIVIRPGRVPLKLPLICVAFVAGGAFLIANGDIIAGTLGVVFFGLCLVGFVILEGRRMLGRPVLVIDDEGYLDRSSLVAPGRVAWSEVRRVRIESVTGQRFLAVEPADPEAIMTRATRMRRWLMRLNRGMGFEVLNIAEVMLPLSLETLVEVIREHNPALIVDSNSDGDTRPHREATGS